MNPQDLERFARQMFPQLRWWRRDFHRYPETGWTEFRTTAKIAEILDGLGFQIAMGSSIIRRESRMGVPDPEHLQKAKKRAARSGIPEKWLKPQQEGLTGVVGTWETGRPGPTVAFRFDIDALPIRESESPDHPPRQEQFHSLHLGEMHACGHDGHSAIGLGVATLIPQLRKQLTGTIKLIFQPAEEGARGAQAMVDAGVLEGVDIFLSGHIGLGANRDRLVACGVTHLLATTKMDITLKGVSSHAAHSPEQGRNALLAAAAATVQLHTLPRHSDGLSRIHVGVLRAGTGRNIVADEAFLQLETRGETSEIQEFMKTESLRILQHTARAHGVSEEIEVTGEASSASCDPSLVQWMEDQLARLPEIDEVLPFLPFNASEDAATMMEAVQRQGGRATYLLFGSRLKETHHHPAFDFNEDTLLLALRVYGHLLLNLSDSPFPR